MAQLKPVRALNSQQPDQEAVYRLQAVLQYFIDSRNDLTIDDGLRVRFSEERSRLEYGYATIAVLRATQRALGLVESDSVDADTARKINDDHLAKANMLAPEPSHQRSNRVSGTVRNSLGIPLAGVRVEALDRDLRGSSILGEGATDAHGRYNIQYAPSEVAPGEAGTADLSLRLSLEKSKYLYQSEVRYNVPAELEWDITLNSNAGLRHSEFSGTLDAVVSLLPWQGVSIADLQKTEAHHTQGPGFQEVIHQQCLAIELELAGLSFVREQEHTIYYDGIETGARGADFVVENQVIAEIKADN